MSLIWCAAQPLASNSETVTSLSLRKVHYAERLVAEGYDAQLFGELTAEELKADLAAPPPRA